MKIGKCIYNLCSSQNLLKFIKMSLNLMYTFKSKTIQDKVLSKARCTINTIQNTRGLFVNREKSYNASQNRPGPKNDKQ